MAAAAAAAGSGGGREAEGVLVPLIDEGAVHILPSDLPEDDEAKAEVQLEMILGVLQAEIAHPRHWMEVAVSSAAALVLCVGLLCLCVECMAPTF